MNVTKDYTKDLYLRTESVSDSLLSENTDIEDKLLDESNIDFYPLEAGVEDPAAQQYIRAGHAVSYLVAGEYTDVQNNSLGPAETRFFQNRKTNFEKFESEITDSTSNTVTLRQEHLWQYANLYSRICQEEGIEPSYSASGIVIMEKPDQQDAVLEVVKDLDGGLSDESLDLK